MHRGRLWTMRQYAGFGSAESTNQRFKLLLASGQTGLSVAFDLPTQMGRDSDHPLARGEVGRTGVAISTLEDMRPAARRAAARAGLHLDDHQRHRRHPAGALRGGGRRAGHPARAACPGTVQNDILKEYIARGTYIYPPAPVDAPGGRHPRLLPGRAAPLERHQRQRLPHPRGRLGRGPGGGLHAGRRHRLPGGGASPPGWPSTSSRRGSRSSSTPTRTSWRRWPSSGPPAGCGRASCAIASAPAIPARPCCASTPRPPARP